MADVIEFKPFLDASNPMAPCPSDQARPDYTASGRHSDKDIAEMREYMRSVRAGRVVERTKLSAPSIMPTKPGPRNQIAWFGACFVITLLILLPLVSMVKV